MKVGFVSLGCSKNLVDTEMMIGLFKKNGFEIVNDEKQAEIIVINTCGFITSAKEEAIDTILEMSQYKTEGNCKYLIVTGCMVQRYKKQLIRELPEVDLFIKVDDYDMLWKEITRLIRFNKSEEYCMKYENRVITTGVNTAYLKVAEGCSNNCTYCAIPKIRGPFKSRPMEEILEEAKLLAKKGIKEVIVIAQDTTKYGVDLYGEYKLAELLQELTKIKEFEWIRFLYAYPESITDELIHVVKNNEKICNYFDIPIQHISNSILKVMNRKSTKESTISVIEKIRKNIPNVIIRTSLIVGFPGETKEDFNELYNFVKETKFDKLGVFQYSKEDGTPAEKLKNQVHHKVKKVRYETIMKLQKEINNDLIKKYIGTTYKALIEAKTADDRFYIARTYMDSPDVDSVIYIKNASQENYIGKFVNCVVIESKEYDLIAEKI